MNPNPETQLRVGLAKLSNAEKSYPGGEYWAKF